MDNYGLLINAAVSLGIAVVAIIVGIMVMRRYRSERVRPAAVVFSLYWISLALLYFFVALRTMFGYLGYPQLDLIFFYVDNVFGGLMPPCAAFLFIYFVTGGKTRYALIPSLAILAVWVVWNVVNITGGAGNYVVQFWFTEWTPNSPLARTLSIFGLYLPAVVSMLGMNFALIRAQSRIARYRIVMTSISMIVAVSVIIIDYLAPGPPWIRMIIFIAALLGLFAYVPPKFLHRWLEMEKT